MCVDQSETYVEIMRAEIGEENARIVHGDSRDLSFLKDDTVGLVVTSPPYWNKADYGGNGHNLGNLAGYREFIRGMEPAMHECARVLEPGRKLALVTANVNQYTDHGLLTFPLAADMLGLMRDAGLVIVAEVIWNKDGTGGKWGSWGSQRPIFGSYPFPPNLLFKTVHEHILIAAKPPANRVRNKKALPYEDLMA